MCLTKRTWPGLGRFHGGPQESHRRTTGEPQENHRRTTGEPRHPAGEARGAEARVPSEFAYVLTIVR